MKERQDTKSVYSSGLAKIVAGRVYTHTNLDVTKLIKWPGSNFWKVLEHQNSNYVISKLQYSRLAYKALYEDFNAQAIND